MLRADSSNGGVTGYRSTGNTTRAILNLSSYGPNNVDSIRHGNDIKNISESCMRGTFVVRDKEETADDVDKRGDSVTVHQEKAV